MESLNRQRGFGCDPTPWFTCGAEVTSYAGAKLQRDPVRTFAGRAYSIAPLSGSAFVRPQIEALSTRGRRGHFREGAYLGIYKSIPRL